MIGNNEDYLTSVVIPGTRPQEIRLMVAYNAKDCNFMHDDVIIVTAKAENVQTIGQTDLGNNPKIAVLLPEPDGKTCVRNITLIMNKSAKGGDCLSVFFKVGETIVATNKLRLPELVS